MNNNKINLAPQKKNGAQILLDALSIVAEKNATMLCKGFMYEPEIPEKLRSKEMIMFRKSVKKMTGVLAATLMIGSLGFTMPVHAATESYSWHFNSTSGTLPTNSNYKNDNEQKYYLTINSGNVSSQNVFGARIRRSADNAAMSNYSTHTSNKKAQSYAYTASANTTTLYYMKGKKDTASTSTTTLDVGGKVTY